MIYLIPPYLLIPSLAALTAAARLISVNLHNAAIHCIDPSITYFQLLLYHLLTHRSPLIQ